MSSLVRLPSAGAIVTFEGTVRDVEFLDYEAYREMAEEKMAEIVSECVARHGLEAAAVEHRVGRVALGEPGVVVAVAAGHRAAAFAGAREMIDRIKAEAPIWKRELNDGDVPLGTRPGGRLVSEPGLTHLDQAGAARMVDVGDKQVTHGRARRSRACV